MTMSKGKEQRKGKGRVDEPRRVGEERRKRKKNERKKRRKTRNSGRCHSTVHKPYEILIMAVLLGEYVAKETHPPRRLVR